MKMFVFVVALSAASIATAAETKKTPWKITGQLEEACTCNAACPCWFNSLPSKMNCGGGQVLFIEKGKYGNVKLDGLAVGNFGQSPDGQTMMCSFGNWNFSYVYVDEKANPDQRAALEAIAKQTLPAAASKKTETRYVPIARQVAGKEHTITLGQYGSFAGHLIEGGLGGSPKIVNPPGADPIHKEYHQGKTTDLTFNDAGQNWKTKDSNYMHGTFTVDSDQYAKYAAGLAQKQKDAEKKD